MRFYGILNQNLLSFETEKQQLCSGNRLVGKDGINFWGHSFVSDPYGKVLAQAADDQEEVLLCSVDLAFIDQVRDGYCFPFRDRRTDSYGDLTELCSSD